MVPAENKTKHFLSVNHTTKSIHRHLHHQVFNEVTFRDMLLPLPGPIFKAFFET